MTMQRMPIPVGQKFDPTNPKHVDTVLAAIDPALYGTGWKIEHYDQADGKLYVTRQDAVSSVEAGANEDHKTVRLGPEYGPGDGEKVAKRFESIPDFEGYVMTHYDSYRAIARLAKLSPDEVRCRDAIAIVVGAKPWEVRVSKRRGGGFHVGLPKTYTPSKHDAKLDEVITTAVGAPGWYSKIDVPKLTMDVIPSTQPTFPGGIAFPLDLAAKVNTQDHLIFGQTLGPNGDEDGKPLALTLTAGPHSTINGTTGSGKSSVINGLIYGALQTGMELVIVDVPHKAVDYLWCKPYVRTGGWGCESLEQAVASLKLTYEEGERRARVLKQYGVQRMDQLPQSEIDRMPTILIVVDELSGLLQLTDKMAMLPKDHPERVEAERENMLHGLLLGVILKVAAEMRFTGLRMVLSTQVANSTTGIPPKLRTLLSNKILLGVNATEANRNQTFSDPSGVPAVPDHVKADPKAGRGVGVAEMEGVLPAVFKGYFREVPEYEAILATMNLRRTPAPEPSEDDCRRLMPYLYEDEDGHPVEQLKVEKKRFSGGPLANDPDAGGVDQNGNRLTGAAAAAAASKRHANV